MKALLPTAGVPHADETTARAERERHYVHIARTEYLTLMHVGGRSGKDIEAGGILKEYTGTLVRDGYAGYAHLPAVHAWCAAHLVRDPRAVSDPDPDAQLWAIAMADTLNEANRAAHAAREAGADRLDDATLAQILNHYRGAIAKGTCDNRNRPGALAAEARELPRRHPVRGHDPALRHRPRRRRSRTMSPSAGHDLSKSRNEPPAGPGAPSTDSPTSPSSRPTSTPPPNGASTNTTLSNGSSPPAPGYHQPLLRAE